MKHRLLSGLLLQIFLASSPVTASDCQRKPESNLKLYWLFSEIIPKNKVDTFHSPNTQDQKYFINRLSDKDYRTSTDILQDCELPSKIQIKNSASVKSYNAHSADSAHLIKLDKLKGYNNLQ